MGAAQSQNAAPMTFGVNMSDTTNNEVYDPMDTELGGDKLNGRARFVNDSIDKPQVVGTPLNLTSVTDAEIEALEGERLMRKETPNETAQRILNESLVPAIQSMVKLAKKSTNERVRLNAAQYIIERNLGRVQDTPPPPPKDAFSDLLADCVSSIDENHGKIISEIEANLGKNGPPKGESNDANPYAG